MQSIGKTLKIWISYHKSIKLITHSPGGTKTRALTLKTLSHGLIGELSIELRTRKLPLRLMILTKLRNYNCVSTFCPMGREWCTCLLQVIEPTPRSHTMPQLIYSRRLIKNHTMISPERQMVANSRCPFCQTSTDRPLLTSALAFLSRRTTRMGYSGQICWLKRKESKKRKRKREWTVESVRRSEIKTQRKRNK